MSEYIKLLFVILSYKIFISLRLKVYDNNKGAVKNKWESDSYSTNSRAKERLLSVKGVGVVFLWFEYRQKSRHILLTSNGTE